MGWIDATWRREVLQNEWRPECSWSFLKRSIWDSKAPCRCPSSYDSFWTLENWDDDGPQDYWKTKEKNEKNVEPIQLVRYYPGQFFKSHYDYLDRNVDIYKENIEKNGQREFTFFVYLNTIPKNKGGTTYFPKLDKHFQAKQGQAIFWSNMVNGEDDPRMLHSGTELFEGVKYGLNVWIREKEYVGSK